MTAPPVVLQTPASGVPPRVIELGQHLAREAVVPHGGDGALDARYPRNARMDRFSIRFQRRRPTTLLRRRPPDRGRSVKLCTLLLLLFSFLLGRRRHAGHGDVVLTLPMVGVYASRIKVVDSPGDALDMPGHVQRV